MPSPAYPPLARMALALVSVAWQFGSAQAAAVSGTAAPVSKASPALVPKASAASPSAPAIRTIRTIRFIRRRSRPSLRFSPSPFAGCGPKSP